MLAWYTTVLFVVRTYITVDNIATNLWDLYSRQASGTQKLWGHQILLYICIYVYIILIIVKVLIILFVIFYLLQGCIHSHTLFFPEIVLLIGWTAI